MGQPGRPRPLHGALVGRIFTQLLSAVGYLRTKRICHRDLKLANILVGFADTAAEEVAQQNFNGTVTIKITDFGFARMLPMTADVNVQMSSCGTRLYMAPERLIEYNPYGFPSDIWSLGLILFELISSGQHLFNGCHGSVEAIRQEQQHVVSRLNQRLSEDYIDLKDLLLGMLAYEPGQRWTLAQIAAHPWVADHIVKSGIDVTLPASTDVSQSDVTVPKAADRIANRLTDGD